MSEMTGLVGEEVRTRWHRVVQADEAWRNGWRELFDVDLRLLELQREMEAYCANWPVDLWGENVYDAMMAGRFDWSMEWDRMFDEWHSLQDRREEVRQRLRNGGVDGPSD